METDWKKFQAIVPSLRERYIAEQNRRLVILLSSSNKTETERFWAAQKFIEKQARILCDCLDGHSRSKMFLAMLSMKSVGMLKSEDLADFSDELKRRVLDWPT